MSTMNDRRPAGARVHLMTGASPTLYGDANRTLGVGSPANPYAGRLYFDGEWRRDIHYHDARETRVSLSYTLLPKWKWLGTHRFAGMVSNIEEYDERANSWLVLGGSPFNPVITNANSRDDLVEPRDLRFTTTYSY